MNKQEKTSLYPHLCVVEYVLLFECNMSHFAKGPRSPKAGQLSGVDWLSVSALKGHRKFIVPTPKKDEVFLENLDMFVFPKDIKLSVERRPPYKHSFVLTGGVGERLYVFCYTKDIPVSKEVLLGVRMEIAHNIMLAADPELAPSALPDRLFSPQTICVVSCYPFHDALTRALKRICKCRDSFDESLARRVYEVLKAEEAIVTTPYWVKSDGKKRVKNRLMPIKKRNHSNPLGRKVQFYLYNAPYSNMPHIETSQLKTLFHSLEPKNVIHLINALLCEVSVLVVATTIDILTPVLEALLALMYPLEWPYIYIPVLPASLSGLFDAP